MDHQGMLYFIQPRGCEVESGDRQRMGGSLGFEASISFREFENSRTLAWHMIISITSYKICEPL